MSLIPWRGRNDIDPFRAEFDSILNRFPFQEADWHLPATFSRKVFPPVNISETEKAWTVAFELPGLDEKDIQVQVMGRQLVVSGERKWEQEKKGKEFRRVESQYGSFERAIALPDNLRLDPDAIAASYRRGILEVTLPKVEPTPAAKIPVKVNG